VVEAIEERAREGYTPAQIERELSQMPQYATRLPTIRTIQRIVADVKDVSPEWSIATADPADLPLVVGVLPELVEQTGGRRLAFTTSEAAWVARVRRAAPDLAAKWALWLAAYKYLTRDQKKEPTTDLDLLLAFAPWRDDASFQRFVAAIPQEWVQGPGIQGGVMDACRMEAERTGRTLQEVLEQVREKKGGL